LTAPNRGISRESVASGNQPQDPNPPYKQEVAGSSPAPAHGRETCSGLSLCWVGSSSPGAVWAVPETIWKRERRAGV